ncbi:C45 family autoproteolytic acyltransferase/hydolase [Ornithinibacillus halophilus]|uniref:Predicted choloylglycine hydrolase n=1 Tax=Ornithinibacillus halophilus TaxID=930117 RepID=A0A1M5E091_9BACI|nr:C45 family peptidase [Ornithinibacillus halophilus]SHF72678.1 Predicted choloylglycine hydrolase [Ornithinibacillus halophilus]
MKQVYSDVLQFRGNHYNFGYWQGELLKDSPILPNREKQWAPKRERHFRIDERVVKKTILQFAPGVWEEIEGLADSLKWNMRDAIREFGGYYLEYGRSGCSVLTSKDYMVRNYDNHPLSYEGRYLAYQPTDRGYAIIGPSMQITGRIDGMNEKGLAVGYNFVNRKGSGDGFICNMIGRLLLEVCSNVEEAVDLLKEIPHRHTFSYIVLDQTGKSSVVEASPRKIEVHQSNACTNHFEKLTDENRYRVEESINRQEVIKQKSLDLHDPYEAFQLMNDVEQGVFSNKYGAWAGTLHTAIYLPKQMKVGFSLGGNQPPYMMDFQRWLDGYKLAATRIKGSLDNESPFINMVLLDKVDIVL